jgi:hypothetical protein
MDADFLWSILSRCIEIRSKHWRSPAGFEPFISLHLGDATGQARGLNQTQHMFMFNQVTARSGKRALRTQLASDEVEQVKRNWRLGK